MAKIVLGFMGAGKTTVSRLLDEDFVDMDALITERIGMPIADYFASHGEPAFREIESQVLTELVQTDAVVSTGGGVVVSPDNRKILASNACNIYLKADFETLYERIRQDKDHQRPLFLQHSKEAFRDIYDERQPLYEEVATQVIIVDGKTPGEIVEAIR